MKLDDEMQHQQEDERLKTTIFTVLMTAGFILGACIAGPFGSLIGGFGAMLIASIVDELVFSSKKNELPDSFIETNYNSSAVVIRESSTTNSTKKIKNNLINTNSYKQDGSVKIEPAPTSRIEHQSSDFFSGISKWLGSLFAAKSQLKADETIELKVISNKKL